MDTMFDWNPYYTLKAAANIASDWFASLTGEQQFFGVMTVLIYLTLRAILRTLTGRPHLNRIILDQFGAGRKINMATTRFRQPHPAVMKAGRPYVPADNPALTPRPRLYSEPKHPMAVTDQELFIATNGRESSMEPYLAQMRGRNNLSSTGYGVQLGKPGVYDIGRPKG